jgi:hypothetical protein
LGDAWLGTISGEQIGRDGHSVHCVHLLNLKSISDKSDTILLHHFTIEEGISQAER